MSSRIKKVFLSFAVVLLVVLNIWHWWPTSISHKEKMGSTAATFSIEDFEIKMNSADSLQPAYRDLFHPQRSVAKKVVTAPPPVVIQPPPAKSSEEIARENAQAEFAKIRCVGVSIRNERIQAYLILNANDSLLVTAGDKVGSHFVVEKVMSDGVSLRDPDTGVGGQISVSGK